MNELRNSRPLWPRGLAARGSLLKLGATQSSKASMGEGRRENVVKERKRERTGEKKEKNGSKGVEGVLPLGTTQMAGHLLGQGLNALKTRGTTQPSTDALGLNDHAPFLCHSEILINWLSCLVGCLFSGHLCYLHWAVSFIYRLKHSRLEGN